MAFGLLIVLGVVFIYFTNLNILGVSFMLLGVYFTLLLFFNKHVKRISIAFGSFLIASAIISIIIFRNDSEKVLQALSLILIIIFMYFLTQFLIKL